MCRSCRGGSFPRPWTSTATAGATGEEDAYEERIVEHRCRRGRGGAVVGWFSPGTIILRWSDGVPSQPADLHQQPYADTGATEYLYQQPQYLQHQPGDVHDEPRDVSGAVSVR